MIQGLCSACMTADCLITFLITTATYEMRQHAYIILLRLVSCDCVLEAKAFIAVTKAYAYIC